PHGKRDDAGGSDGALAGQDCKGGAQRRQYLRSRRRKPCTHEHCNLAQNARSGADQHRAHTRRLEEVDLSALKDSRLGLSARALLGPDYTTRLPSANPLAAASALSSGRVLKAIAAPGGNFTNSVD